MYLETVREIRAAEQRCEQDKLNARNEAEQRIAGAEKAGKALLEQTREQLHQKSGRLMQDAAAQAEKHRNEVTAETEQLCDALRKTADGHMAQAVGEIVRRVVDR